MKRIKFTLVADGPSDIALIPILTWALRKQLTQTSIQAQLADLRRLPNPPSDLKGKITEALKLYPCDVLFVHRDADRQDPELRCGEIETAMAGARETTGTPPYIRVVPIQMLEAWLLFDEAAIRKASGNPNGRNALDLPLIHNLESTPDPKELLYRLLKSSSGLRGRRLKKFKPRKCARLVAENIRDFSALRRLPAFGRMEAEIQKVVSCPPADSRSTNKPQP